MNESQERAFKIWFASATLDNNFTTIALPELAKNPDVSASKSTLGRWKIKFDWDKKLELKVNATIIHDKSTKEIIEKSSLAASIQKSEEDFEINRSNKLKSYKLIEFQLNLLIQQVDDGGNLSDKDLRFITENLKITADREDKLLDRVANAMSQSKAMSSDDAMKLIMGESAVEVEEIEDVEIED